MKAFEEIREKDIDVGFTKSSAYWIGEKDLKAYLLKLREAIDQHDDNALMEKIFGDLETTTGKANAVKRFIDFLTEE